MNQLWNNDSYQYMLSHKNLIANKNFLVCSRTQLFALNALILCHNIIMNIIDS